MQKTHLTISYDDPKAIRLKCDFAKNNHLAGVMIWNIGADVTGDRTPLLDAIAESFGAKPQTMPASGLVKTLQSFDGSVKDAYNKLVLAHDKLMAAGKKDEATAADPGASPDLALPTSTDSQVLGKKLLDLTDLLGVYNLKLSDSQAALNAIPVPEVVGMVLKHKKGKVKLLVDDFEKGISTNLLLGEWMTDCDKNNLGTTLNPMPFKPTPGGHTGSAKFAAHIFGHFGKSVSPWPFSALTCTLAPGGSAVDISGFKTVEFWVKGDGKEYSFNVARAAVQDYCNYRKEFKSSLTWTKVSIKLADLTQPAWGKQVPFKLNDVLYISFTPASNFSDEDYDFWVDDVTFVK